jgi:hypothetical protein
MRAMLSIIILGIIMLTSIMLIVIMVNVVAPMDGFFHHFSTTHDKYFYSNVLLNVPRLQAFKKFYVNLTTHLKLMHKYLSKEISKKFVRSS